MKQIIQVNEGKPLSFISWKEQGIFPWKICRLLLPSFHHSCLAALCLRGHQHTAAPSEARAAPSLFLAALQALWCPPCFPTAMPCWELSVFAHTAGPAAPSSTPKETAGKRDSCWTAVMDPTTSLQPVSATLLAAFPPVLSKAKWAHLGVSYCNHEFWGPRNYLKLTPFARFFCEAGMS